MENSSYTGKHARAFYISSLVMKATVLMLLQKIQRPNMISPYDLRLIAIMSKGSLLAKALCCHPSDDLYKNPFSIIPSVYLLIKY